MAYGSMMVESIPNEVLTIYSRDAMLAAMPQLYFRGFVNYKAEFAEPGLTVQFLKLANLPEGDELLPDEASPIKRTKYSDSTVQVSVNEYGKAVQVSKRALQASFRPLMKDAATLLGRNYGLTVDRVCRDAFLAVSNKQYAGSRANTSSITSADVFKTTEVKNAVETLKTLNVAPIVRGGDQFYVCIAHPHQLRKLRDDPNWFNARAYVNPADIYNGECGRYENVIFLETTQMPILTGAGSGGINVYRSVLFGADCVGFGEKVPFGLVDDGVEDFGRFVSLGWYSIFGAGVINDYGVEIQTA